MGKYLHNVGGLPEYMKLKLLEPLREWFKDEVRKLGVELGLPYDMVYRHPFPGLPTTFPASHRQPLSGSDQNLKVI